MYLDLGLGASVAGSNLHFLMFIGPCTKRNESLWGSSVCPPLSYFEVQLPIHLVHVQLRKTKRLAVEVVYGWGGPRLISPKFCEVE